MELQWQSESISDFDVISTVFRRGLTFDFFNRIGHKRTFALQQTMSALPPKATEKGDIEKGRTEKTSAKGHSCCRDQANARLRLACFLLNDSLPERRRENANR